MSLNIQRPSEPEANSFPPDGLSVVSTSPSASAQGEAEIVVEIVEEARAPLGSLPVGARLVIRCKKDWRSGVVSTVAPEGVKLLVHSPRGGTYRLRRPADAPLHFDGCIPVLADCDETLWRDEFAAYDRRW